jgi:hypothetical protein
MRADDPAPRDRRRADRRDDLHPLYPGPLIDQRQLLRQIEPRPIVERDAMLDALRRQTGEWVRRGRLPVVLRDDDVRQRRIAVSSSSGPTRTASESGKESARSAPDGSVQARAPLATPASSERAAPATPRAPDAAPHPRARHRSSGGPHAQPPSASPPSSRGRPQPTPRHRPASSSAKRAQPRRAASRFAALRAAVCRRRASARSCCHARRSSHRCSRPATTTSRLGFGCCGNAPRSLAGRCGEWNER